MRRFFTESGIEVPAVTAEQMRQLDRIAMQETGPNLYQMMENAGRNLAELAIELLGKHWKQARILVLAGSGGNGGGGICAARHLANRNVQVALCLARELKPDSVPQFQYQVFQQTAGKSISPDELNSIAFDLILDALVGYGLHAAPTGSIERLIHWANLTSTPILALDIPSGVDASSGETPGEYIQAQWTMTLALPKTGLRKKHQKELYLADIGIPQKAFERINIPYTAPFEKYFYLRLNIND